MLKYLPTEGTEPLFNHLPNSIKNTANETKMFKKTLKKFLRDNSFYTVDEFINFRE